MCNHRISPNPSRIATSRAQRIKTREGAQMLKIDDYGHSRRSNAALAAYSGLGSGFATHGDAIAIY